MLGIGHAHQNSPDGIAWKQNRDFENLLKRLNGLEGEGEKEGAVMSGFHRPREEEVKEDAGEKRKRVGGDEGEVDEKEAKRRRKEEKAKRKEEKAKRKAEKAAAKESSESEAEEAPKPVFARAPYVSPISISYIHIIKYALQTTLPPRPPHPHETSRSH